MSNEIIHALEKNGWRITQNHVWHLGITPLSIPVKSDSIYLFEKTYRQAGINIVISIHPYQEEFVVIDSAYHRMSDSTTVDGATKTLNDALILAQSSCQFWDEDLDKTPNGHT